MAKLTTRMLSADLAMHFLGDLRELHRMWILCRIHLAIASAFREKTRRENYDRELNLRASDARIDSSA
jgi:hypothetical protein